MVFDCTDPILFHGLCDGMKVKRSVRELNAKAVRLFGDLINIRNDLDHFLQRDCPARFGVLFVKFLLLVFQRC